LASILFSGLIGKLVLAVGAQIAYLITYIGMLVSLLGIIKGILPPLLMLGVALGFVRGLTGKLNRKLSYGFYFGLFVATIFGIFIIIDLLYGTVGMIQGGAEGTVLKVIGGIFLGLSLGFIFATGVYISYFNIFSYPFHIGKCIGGINFLKNPYINYQKIQLPLVGVTQKMTTLAQKTPKEAEDFVNFLLEHRPLQRKLAMHIRHAAMAGTLHQLSLKDELPASPIISKGTPEFVPTTTWFEAFERLKESLSNYQKQSNTRFKKVAFEEVHAALDVFDRQTKVESPLWNHYYFDALNKWQKWRMMSWRNWRMKPV